MTPEPAAAPAPAEAEKPAEKAAEPEKKDKKGRKERTKEIFSTAIDIKEEFETKKITKSQDIIDFIDAALEERQHVWMSEPGKRINFSAKPRELSRIG